MAGGLISRFIWILGFGLYLLIWLCSILLWSAKNSGRTELLERGLLNDTSDAFDKYPVFEFQLNIN